MKILLYPCYRGDYMNKIFGENIKILRKSKGYTQEDFAELVGVSFQAVSKWERGESYPDITLLPAISKLFNISIDELLGNIDNYSESDIKHYLDMYDNYTFENQKEVYQEFEKAAKLYPNDFRIQIRYMDLINKVCALITPQEYESKTFTNFDKESKRVKHLYSFIIDNCTNDSIRVWAKRIMCEHLMYAYDCRGFYKENLKVYDEILNTLPSIYETKEYVSLMERDITKWYSIREDIFNEIFFLLSRVIVEYCYYSYNKFSVEYRIEVIENMNSFLETFSKQFFIDKNIVQYIYNFGLLARFYYEIDKPEKVYENLEKAIKEGIEFDKLGNAQLLLKHYEKDNTMTMCERLKLLMQKYYGFSEEFKNEERFKKLIEKLS